VGGDGRDSTLQRSSYREVPNTQKPVLLQARPRFVVRASALHLRLTPFEAVAAPIPMKARTISHKAKRPSVSFRMAVWVARSSFSHSPRRYSGLRIDSPSASARSMVISSRSLSWGSVPANGR